MSINLGVAKGYLELDISSLTDAVSGAKSAFSQIERSGKLAESEMRLMQSTARGTGSVLSQAAAQTQSLTRALDAAKDKASVYKSGISGLNSVVKTARQEQATLAQKIQAATAQYDAHQDTVKALKDTYDAARQEARRMAQAHGEASDEAKAAAEAEESAGSAYTNALEKSRRYRNEIAQMEAKHGDLTLEIQHSGEKIEEFQTGLNNARADIANLTAQLEASRSKLNTWGTAFQQVGSKVTDAGQSLSKAGGALTLGVTTPLIAAGTAALKSAIDFESAFAGVQKTVDATDTQLAKLKQGIIDMSQELPASAVEISAVAEAAGQLGIQTDNILSFSRVMVDLGESTNMSADTAATTLARLANITGMSQENFDRLGSVIVDLGNNLATTESEITEMGLRLAGAGSQVGMSEAQILSFAGALSSVGIEAEAGGSAVSKVIVDMQLAVESGGDALENFASVAEMSADQFAGAFREDAASALLAFIEGLATCDERGVSAIGTLQDMGIEEVRMRDALLRAAGASEVFADALEIGSTAWEENNALTKEASQRYQTTESKIKMAKNTITEAGRSIGETMLPVVADLAQSAADLAKQFAALPPETQKNILAFAGAAAAAGPLLKVTGSLVSGTGKLVTGTGNLMRAMSKTRAVTDMGAALKGVSGAASTAAGGVGGLTGVLSSLAGPAGIAVLAGTAIVGIGAACYAAYQQAKANDLSEHFGNIRLSAEEAEEAARRLLTNDWTVRLTVYSDAKESLSELRSTLEETVSALNKTDWMVSIGLALTEEEKQDYIAQTESFVSECQSYIEQRGYTLSLAVNASFSPGSTTGAGLSAFVNSYTASASAELESLGERLADLVNESFENNTFAKNRVQIEKIRQQMSEIVEELNRYQAEADNMQFEMSLNNMDIRLDADSFKRVNEEINTYTQQIVEQAEEANKDTLIAISAQYDMLLGSGVSRETADKFKAAALRELEINMAQNEAEVRLTGVDFALDTLQENYADNLEAAQPFFTEKLEEILQDGIGKAKTEGAFSQLFLMMSDEFKNGVDGFETGQKENIRQMLAELGDQPDALANLAQTYVEAGKTVPQSIASGLSDVYEMELMVGNVDHVFEYMGMQLGQSPAYLDMIAQAVEDGVQVPEGIISGMEISSGMVFDATTNTWAQVTGASETVLPEILTFMNENGALPGQTLADSMAAQYNLVYDNGAWLVMQTADGAASSLPGVLNSMSAAGIDIPDSLITSMSGKSAEVQTQAAELISQLQYASEAERPGILAELGSLGITSGDTLVSSILSKQGETEAAATALFQLIGSASDAELPGLLEKAQSLGISIPDSAIESLRSKFGDMDATSREAAQNYVSSFDDTISANGGSSETVISGWTKAIIDSLLTGLDEHSPSRQTKEAAQNYVLGFDNEIKAKSGTSAQGVRSWATKLAEALTSARLPDKAKDEGSKTGTNFSSALSRTSSAAQTAGRSVAQSANNGLKAYHGQSYSWGYDMGNGLANGLWGSIGAIRNAAYAAANAARAVLHFSRPDEGPLRDYETYMPDMVAGLARTLRQSAPVLSAEATRAATSISNAFQITPLATRDLLEEASASLRERYTLERDNVLRVEFGKFDFEPQNSAVLEELTALRAELQALRDVTAENKPDNDALISGIAGAVSRVQIRTEAVISAREAGRAVTPEVDKQQGASTALRQRGVI